jgi:putative ABC transport system permease protein
LIRALSRKPRRKEAGMTSLWQDLRIGLRMLAKAPGITIAAVFAFGLGIASAAAMLSVSRIYLTSPISFPDVNRVLMVLSLAPGQTEGWNEVSPADFQDWRSQNHSFESLAAYQWDDVNLTGAGEPVKLQGFRVSANFFDVLRASPLLGRGFVRGEDEPGQEHEVVLSAALWRRQFGSDRNVVGRTVHLDGMPMQIVGVMDDQVRFPISAELWLPLALSPQEKTARNIRYLSPVGRLHPDVSVAQAQAEMATIQRRLETAFPETERGWSVTTPKLGEFVAGPGRNYAILCLVAAAFVLLIACTNVANLLLARNHTRQNEFSIRAALGAKRLHLARQLLVESVLLALGGALLGLLLGSWWISLIRGAMPPEVERYIPSWDHVRLDLKIFLCALMVAIVAGILAGLLPAFYGSSTNLNDNLKEAGRGAAVSLSRMRLRSAFVVVQVALSLVLLVGAALMARGVQTLFRLNFKFDPQSVVTFRVALPASRYENREQRVAFFDRLMDSWTTGHGLQAIAVATQVPFSGGDTESFHIEGQPLQEGEFRTAECNNISPAYFQLLHVPVFDGREFNDQDRQTSPPVAIISENLAKQYWPGQSPLGHRLRLGDQNSKEPWATIVGVVGEVSYNPWRHDAPPQIYFPFRQHPWADSYVAVRTAMDPRAFLPSIRAAVTNVDSEQPVYDIFSLERVISNQILGLSYVAVLLGVLGLMALVLSAVGISAVMAYSVTQRVHEIGVRMALGATPKNVLRMFVAHGLKLMIAGVVIGLPLAIGLARLLSSLLYGVESNDFVSFFAGAALLGLVVFLACYLPARQATRVDPMVALRYE